MIINPSVKKSVNYGEEVVRLRDGPVKHTYVKIGEQLDITAAQASQLYAKQKKRTKFRDSAEKALSTNAYRALKRAVDFLHVEFSRAVLFEIIRVGGLENMPGLGKIGRAEVLAFLNLSVEEYGRMKTKKPAEKAVTVRPDLPWKHGLSRRAVTFLLATFDAYSSTNPVIVTKQDVLAALQGRQLDSRKGFGPKLKKEICKEFHLDELTYQAIPVYRNRDDVMRNLATEPCRKDLLRALVHNQIVSSVNDLFENNVNFMKEQEATVQELVGILGEGVSTVMFGLLTSGGKINLTEVELTAVTDSCRQYLVGGFNAMSARIHKAELKKGG